MWVGRWQYPAPTAGLPDAHARADALASLASLLSGLPCGSGSHSVSAEVASARPSAAPPLRYCTQSICGFFAGHMNVLSTMGCACLLFVYLIF